MVIQRINSSMNSRIAHHLESLFHKVINATSIPIGVLGSHKVAGGQTQKMYMATWCHFWLF